MITRALELRDIDRLREIHSKHFADEFLFPDFLNKFYCAFVIEDNDGIIAAGGIRPICEAILLTDKDRTFRDKKYALAQFLNASIFVTNHQGFNELTAFIQDKDWGQHLAKVGFVPTKGKSLVLSW